MRQCADGSRPIRDTAVGHFRELIAVSPERLQETIEPALDEVRRFFQADRCGLLSVSDTYGAVNVAFASYGYGIEHVSAEVNLARCAPG